MKKSIFLFAAILMMASFSSKLKAQATENTAAGAEIITPITLTETSSLHFGVMSVLGATPGTCVLNTLGARSATGGVNLSATGTAASNATYNVSGNPSTTYALTLPANITVTSGANTMTISSVLARFNAAAADAVTSTLDGTGADSFSVGGTLTVPAAQSAGAYTGTFDVTVAYN